MVVREGVRDRIAESINLAVQHGDGLVLAAHEEKKAAGSVWHDRLFSTLYACPNCKISYEELEPRTFSFNSPYGACPKCEGLGSRRRSIRTWFCPTPACRWPRSRAPWKGESPGALRKHQNHLPDWLTKTGVRWTTPLDKLTAKLRDQCCTARANNSWASSGCSKKSMPLP